MKRRDFLKFATAMAATPLIPALPAAASVPATPSMSTLEKMDLRLLINKIRAAMARDMEGWLFEETGEMITCDYFNTKFLLSRAKDVGVIHDWSLDSNYLNVNVFFKPTRTVGYIKISSVYPEGLEA